MKTGVFRDVIACSLSDRTQQIRDTQYPTISQISAQFLFMFQGGKKIELTSNLDHTQHLSSVPLT